MRSIRTPGAPRQWVRVALIELLDGIAVEPVVANLHPGSKRANRRKFFNREADGFSRAKRR
jgi:hypothetical protein